MGKQPKSDLEKMQSLIKNHSELNKLGLLTPAQIEDILMREMYEEIKGEIDGEQKNTKSE